MRIRSIKPEFWTDRVTGRWDVEMKLAYIALWNVADDEGRFEYEPDLLRAAIFPFGAPFCIETVLSRIAATGKLRLYSVDGLMYGAIPSFGEHQWIQKRKPSKFPPPPAITQEVPAVAPPTVSVRYEYDTSTVRARSGSGIRDQGSGIVAPKKPARSAKPPPPAPTPFVEARDRLVAEFRAVRGAPYLWQGAKDTEGLKRILALNVPLAEIAARWRAGLRAKGWPACANVAQLAAKWNDLTPEVDEHESTFARLRSAAERELAQPGCGDGGDDRPPPESLPASDPLPADGAALSAAVGKLLGAGWSAGVVQDGPPVEHRAERR